MEFLRRTWAEISLDNLTHNYQQLRSRIPAGTKFAGVVKADAYGHGAVRIAKHFEALGADFLAVATVMEAAELREQNIHLPILVLGYTPPEFAAFEAEREIRQEVGEFTHAEALNAALEGTGKRLKIHLKLDTGMTRLGFPAYERPETLEELVQVAAMPNLEIEGVFQHFACADSFAPDAQAYTRLQYERFCAMLDAMAERGIHPAIRHCCNSAATILHPEFAMDLVRPGIAAYGYAPDTCMEGLVPLKPLLSWKAAIAQIREREAGISVSYARTWETSGRQRIAALPVGYGDGLHRRLSDRVRFLLHGREVPQVGRICMDMCMLDVTEVPEAQVGDEVTIIGTEGLCRCGDMAKLLETIPYEITCAIGKRVPRIYIGGEVN